MKREVSLHGVLLAAGLALALAGARCGGGATPVQPIEFNHQLHAGTHAIACETCHRGVRDQPRASLPSIEVCLSCHMKAQSTSPREAAVRELAASGKPLRWVQVTRNPGHVYFTHRMHVSVAGLGCAACHGDVAHWTRPPTEPEEGLTSMKRCMACHRTVGASNECATCHR